MAWLLALGISEYIDSTYAITILCFVFLGAFWLGAYCLRRNLSSALGIWFPLVPAALVSIDRFTVDVALAALAVGFVVEEGWRLFVVMAVAPLARETGLIIPLAFGLDSLLRKNLRGMALAVAGIVPYAAWLVYISQRTATALGMRTSIVPFRGLRCRSGNVAVRCTRGLDPQTAWPGTGTGGRIVYRDVHGLRFANRRLVWCLHLLANHVARTDLPGAHRLGCSVLDLYCATGNVAPPASLATDAAVVGNLARS
jgi:hypothetical protein